MLQYSLFKIPLQVHAEAYHERLWTKTVKNYSVLTASTGELHYHLICFWDGCQDNYTII